MIRTHRCTAWCAHPSHVDLVHYLDGAWTDSEVAHATIADYAKEGAKIVVDRIELAPEAPARPNGQAHLVWWHV